MSQSSYIAAFIVIGFIVFITMRDELRQYMDVLGINGSATAASNVQPNAGNVNAVHPELSGAN